MMTIMDLEQCARICSLRSQGRRLKLWLTLTGEGILVTGDLREPDGRAVIWSKSVLVNWEQAITDMTRLLDVIETMHMMLVEVWRGKDPAMADEAIGGAGPTELAERQKRFHKLFTMLVMAIRASGGEIRIGPLAAVDGFPDNLTIEENVHPATSAIILTLGTRKEVD